MLLITVTQQLLNTFRPFLHKRDVSVSARNLWDIANMADRTKASEQLADYAKSKKVGSRSFSRGSVVLKTYLFTFNRPCHAWLAFENILAYSRAIRAKAYAIPLQVFVTREHSTKQWQRFRLDNCILWHATYFLVLWPFHFQRVQLKCLLAMRFVKWVC